MATLSSSEKEKRRAIRPCFSVLAVVIFAGALPDAAGAEGFAEVYIGGNATQDANGAVRLGPAGGFSRITTRGPIEFKLGPSAGFRGGYWFDSVPWVGLALDMHGYGPIEDEFPDLDVYVFPLSALLMLRVPLLKNSDFPLGRIQPYAGAGPGVFISIAELDLSSEGAPKDFKDTNTDLGIIAMAGVKFHVSSIGDQSASLVGSWTIFLEYGFTRFKPSDYRDNVAGVPVELGIDRLDTHHVVVGVGVHLW